MKSIKRNEKTGTIKKMSKKNGRKQKLGFTTLFKELKKKVNF
jgi:hypothetical protein